MAQVNIRIDDTLKAKAESLFEELGMNISTAFNIFIRQSVRQGSIPFEITTKTDDFYNPANMQRLQHSIEQMEQGNFVVKSIEELEAMENE